MKKILFGTTALLAAGAFAPAAQASEPVKLQLGGYMEYWVAAAQQDGDWGGVAANRANNFDVQGESEIYFKGTTTLDNGMKIGVQVELEAGSNDNAGDIIDESYLWLEGKYGKLIVGSENDAAYLSHISAPEASEMGSGINEGDTNKYLIIPTNVAYLEPQVGVEYIGDANKLTYFTPVFYGFQGDDTVATSERIEKATNIDDAWSFVVNYNNKIGAVGVQATAAYITADDRGAGLGVANSQDTMIQDFSGGLALSYKGFTAGGSYRRMVANAQTSMATRDGSVWDAGVQYAEGPYKVSLSYLKSSVVGARGGVVGTSAGDDEVEMWRLGAGYTLGPGVILFGQLAYLDAQDEATGTTNAVKAQSNSGAYGGVVGLKLNF